MKLRNKTIEELLDLEEEFIFNKDLGKQGSLLLLMQLYEELYKKISMDKLNEYAPSLEQIRKKMISYLIDYGTFMKTEYQKDDHAAEATLKKAIRYQPKLPIAYYRLGFLSYKQEKYLAALTHFKKAIEHQNQCDDKDYRLNLQQQYNAHVYITNSALYIAEETNHSLKEIESEDLVIQLPSYEQSPFYDLIHQNEAYLTNNAFMILSVDDGRMASKEECEALVNKQLLPNTLILYFSDREQSLYFNQNEASLSINHAEMLRYFFRRTSESSPATKNHFARILDSKRDDGEINTNTYTQNITRMREKIAKVIGSEPIIENKRHHGRTAYYYNHAYPFTIIYRSDHSFILD